MNAARQLDWTLWCGGVLAVIAGGLTLAWIQRTAVATADLRRQVTAARSAMAIADHPADEEAPVIASFATPGAMPGAGPAPRDRTEAFFQIAAYREEMAELARTRQVALAEDEAFGFSSHLHAGPSDEWRLLVHRQLEMSRALLRTVIEAAPAKVIEVKRSALGDGAGEAADFLPHRDGAAPLPAVRVSFVGATGALRVILNRLAADHAHLVVTEVEVETPVPPVDGEAPPEGWSQLAAPVPAIFRVTVAAGDRFVSEP